MSLLPNSTPDMVYEASKTRQNSLKPSNKPDCVGKATATPHIAANGAKKPLSVAKTKPNTKWNDTACNDWIFWQCHPLLRDTLEAFGKKRLSTIRLCKISLRLVQGRGYFFRFKSKFYAIDPNFLNKLRARYYKLKAENPRKLEDFTKASDLCIYFEVERGDA